MMMLLLVLLVRRIRHPVLCYNLLTRQEKAVCNFLRTGTDLSKILYKLRKLNASTLLRMASLSYTVCAADCRRTWTGGTTENCTAVNSQMPSVACQLFHHFHGNGTKGKIMAAVPPTKFPFEIQQQKCCVSIVLCTISIMNSDPRGLKGCIDQESVSRNRSLV
jgi:hypothetical protein